jgi:hypothetical protein
MKETLDTLVKGHNSQEDQEWVRTIKTQKRSDVLEVIGTCNYGNLYFAQIHDDGRARIDWIRKQDIGNREEIQDPSKERVQDSVLDKFRARFNKL